MNGYIVAFGDIAKNIKNGELFIAVKTVVEGRDKVTMVPANKTDFFERMDNPEKFEDDSFDDMDGEKALESKD